MMSCLPGRRWRCLLGFWLVLFVLIAVVVSRKLTRLKIDLPLTCHWEQVYRFLKEEQQDLARRVRGKRNMVEEDQD